MLKKFNSFLTIAAFSLPLAPLAHAESSGKMEFLIESTDDPMLKRYEGKEFPTAAQLNSRLNDFLPAGQGTGDLWDPKKLFPTTPDYSSPTGWPSTYSSPS